jgi:ubiquinone/menaquinone biosynthesis C-methylase UbiE
LGPFARDEVVRVLGERARMRGSQERRGPDVVRFEYAGDLRALLRLQTALAAFVLRRFPVPRPKALLSNEHLPALLELIALVRGLHPPGAFRTLELGAAGADSPVMTRLKEELARRAGLAVAPERGDLFLRLRRPPDGGEGWEVLARISPRPLATRAWRVCNMEGALNGTVAHAMALLTRPQARDCVLNIGCGSGTLLVERLNSAPAARAIGCDTSPAALECARANLQAAGQAARAELYAWDARALALPAAAVDALLADLPFGHLVGSHEANLELYPALLAEAARVARPGARFALISHEVRLLEQLLAGAAHWLPEQTIRVTLGGLHPRIFLLRRTEKQTIFPAAVSTPSP